jgi:hypothetical protein
VANRMADQAINIIEQADDIRRFRAKTTADMAFFEQHKFAERLKEYLTSEFGITLSKEREALLSELIADRVTGVSNEADFYEGVLAKESKHGVGFKEEVGDGLTRYLEKLIAQGVDVSYKK